MADEYDVIIVGSGAGGGTLAHRLAPSGKRVLILERGDWLPREIENWDATAVFVDNRYVSKDTWYDDKGNAFQPQIHYFVGGATKFYGAALYRLREQDFRELTHHGGISPAWPIGYDEFEPYYTQAEQLYQVHGARGEDPTDPPAGAPYPFPPVSHEARIQQLFDDMARVGMHPFHAPCGIMLDEANPALSTCIRCATCDGFPCLVHAKSDADVIAVRPSLRYDNVTLVRNAAVQRLETDPSGRRSHRSSPTSTVRNSATPGRWSWYPPVRPTRRSCCWQAPTTSTPTGWPTARTRSGATMSSTTAAHFSPSRWRRTTPGFRRLSG
jgi:choline dehydrogenase-like flavoprotein